MNNKIINLFKEIRDNIERQNDFSSNAIEQDKRLFKILNENIVEKVYYCNSSFNICNEFQISSFKNLFNSFRFLKIKTFLSFEYSFTFSIIIGLAFFLKFQTHLKKLRSIFSLQPTAIESLCLFRY